MTDCRMFPHLRLLQPTSRAPRMQAVCRLWKTFLHGAACVALTWPLGMALPATAQPAPSATPLPAAQPRTDTRLPLFRQIDAALVKTRLQRPERLRFLLADDAPPFTYRNSNGALTGYAVAVAQAICRRARTRCRFIVLPRAQLAQALLDGRGDAVLSGLRPTADTWRRFNFTRPYYKALGRFAVGRQAKIAAATWDALAGRRVVVVKGSVHALWMIRHMGSVRLSLQPTFAKAAEELKEGRADALFADWLQLAFFIGNTGKTGCCRVLPQLFSDRLFAYNHLSMALPAGATALRDFLDRQLDLLQEDGELRILARRFLPIATGTAGVASATGNPARNAAANSARNQPIPDKQDQADAKP